MLAEIVSHKDKSLFVIIPTNSTNQLGRVTVLASTVAASGSENPFKCCLSLYINAYQLYSQHLKERNLGPQSCSNFHPSPPPKTSSLLTFAGQVALIKIPSSSSSPPPPHTLTSCIPFGVEYGEGGVGMSPRRRRKGTNGKLVSFSSELRLPSSRDASFPSSSDLSKRLFLSAPKGGMSERRSRSKMASRRWLRVPRWRASSNNRLIASCLSPSGIAFSTSREELQSCRSPIQLNHGGCWDHAKWLHIA